MKLSDWWRKSDKDSWKGLNVKRILVFGMTPVTGGIENFLRSYISQMDPEQIRFDYLCNFPEPMAYEDEMMRNGSEVFHIAARSTDPLQYKLELPSFFEEYSGDYDAVWVNVPSLANIDYLKMAKKYGIRRRIIHSHASGNIDSGWKGTIRSRLHEMNKGRIAHYATDFWACSEQAADWFYRGKTREQAVIIRNAIDPEQMAFHADKRESLRGLLGWENDYVLGCVGRLCYPKNQAFALEVLSVLKEEMPDARMVFVGEGEDRLKLEEMAASLQLKDSVFWAGRQNDIAGWISAFDCFLFPSEFEGVPVAVLEAQANGVPVLCSSTAVGDDCKMNTNVFRMSLKRPVTQWAEQIVRMRAHCRREKHEITAGALRGHGYDVKDEADRLQSLLTGQKDASF